MTNRNYCTSSNYTDHSTFGGTISNYDYDGHPTITEIAERIMRDVKFDKQCKRNAEIRDRNKNYKRGNR